MCRNCDLLSNQLKMTSNRTIFVACLIFFGSTWVYGDEPHLIDDCLNPGAKPEAFYNKEISKQGSWLHVVEETIRIPDVGFAPGPITCITVTPLDNDVDAGYPKIKEGGIGAKYAVITLRSQKGKGYDFRVTAYWNP